MTWFDSFSPFGMLGFSSEDTPARKAYDQLKNAYGPSFQGPVGEARMYAHAMCLGIAQCELDRAEGQFSSDRIYELLPATEAEYGLIPAPDADMKTRRLALAARKLLRNGARSDAMADGLSGILGANFVKYVTNDASSNPLTPVPANPLTRGTYKSPAETPIQVIRIRDVVLPSATAQTCVYSHVCGENTPLKSGDTLAVDQAIDGICEPVTVLTVSGTHFTAIFSKPHDPGTVATTAPFPAWGSWQRFVLVVVVAAALTNAPLMHTVSEFMKRWTRGVTGWAVIADGGTGHSAGPFLPTVGCPNITPIGTVTY